MGEADTFLKEFGLVELYDFDLSSGGATSLLMSGRKEPMAKRKGYWGLLEKPKAKMFQGAV
jgi:hypothetical protein